MCGNVLGRVFINNDDNKHSLLQKHKEHFALADINKHDDGWNLKQQPCIIQ